MHSVYLPPSFSIALDTIVSGIAIYRLLNIKELNLNFYAAKMFALAVTFNCAFSVINANYRNIEEITWVFTSILSAINLLLFYKSKLAHQGTVSFCIHLYQAFKLFVAYNVVSTSTEFACLVLQFYTAWYLLSDTIQSFIKTTLYEIFCIKGFSLLRTYSKRSLIKSDIEYSDNRYSHMENYEQLEIDTSKSFFLIRFLISVELKEVSIVVLGNAFVNIIKRWRRLVFVAIIAIIESKKVEKAYEIGLLFAVWQLMALVSPVKKYIDDIYISLKERMESLLAIKLVANNEKYQRNLDLKYYSLPQEFSSNLQEIFELTGLTIGELFNIWIVAYKIGWFFVIPIAVTLLQLLSRYLVDKKTDYFNNMAVLKKTPQFYKKYGNIFDNLRAIKFYAWENIFKNNVTVDNHDDKGVPLIWNLANRLISITGVVISEISTAATLLSYLNVSGAAISYSELVLLMDSTNALTSFTESLVSQYSRVSELLKYNNILEMRFKPEENRYIDCNISTKDECAAIKLQNCTFSWGKDKFSLNPITMTVNHGDFVTVVGRIGSGKSSFLEGLCGEMPITDGEGYINGTIAYVSQKPLIFDETFRENVLMGAEYNEKLFKRVVEACALDTDVTQFSDGDMTEIGSNGINLSGGQKVRLALARALYMQADIYLLDDILSAVDAHVERHLVEHVLSDNGILSDKTRILVTHAEHVVPLSNKSIIVKDSSLDIVDQVPIKLAHIMLGNIHKDDKSNESDEYENSDSESYSNDDDSGIEAFTIRPEEGKSDIKLKYIAWFIKNSGYVAITSLIVVKILSAYALYTTESWRISLMSDDNHDTMMKSLKKYLFANMAFEIASCVVKQFEVWISNNYWSTPASINLMTKYVESILSIPLPLAERLPGSTLSNIGTYIGFRLTTVVPGAIYHGVLTSTTFAIGSLIQIAKIAPLMIVPALVYIFVVYYQKKFVSRVAKNARNLYEDHDTYGENKYYVRLYHNRTYLRIHSMIKQYTDNVCSSLVSYCRVEFIASIIYTTESIIADLLLEVIYSIIVLYNIWRFATHQSVSPGHIDIIMSLIQKINTQIFAFVRAYNNVKPTFKGLAMAYIYTEELTREESSVNKITRPDSDWPQNGLIEFSDYKMRYRPKLKTVLKGLSFTVRPNEKVGIVGRTGAGKSSLTYALMRMVDAESGNIKIDGVDISKIGLYDLRSNISIILQDPVLFEGTIRDNLDPEHKFSDNEVWDAINACQLANLLDTPTGTFEYDPDDTDNGPWIEGVGLDKWIEKNGINFSVGQRQLVSLCRALLWQRKIVVLDEATANIDGETDRIMQEVIRHKFTNCTVLTIAHRLNTIMDSDRILVMDNGMVSEFDTPSNLLANKNSHFTKLVESMQLNEATTIGLE